MTRGDGTGPGENGSREPGRTPGFLPAPWGVVGTLYGIGAAFACWLAVVVTFAPMIGESGELENAPLIVRYGLLAILQSVFVAIPVAALLLTRATPAALGLRSVSVPGIAESLACGAGLFGLTLAYDALGRRLFPALAAKAVEEQERQLAMLDGPAPLLWIFVVLLVPVMEETFFRGFVYAGLRGRLEFALASGLSAAFFALFHGMPYSVPPLFAVGLGTAILYERHRSIWACAIAHGAFNMLQLGWETLT